MYKIKKTQLIIPALIVTAVIGIVIWFDQRPAAPDFPSLFITADLHPFEAERQFWHNGALTLTRHERGFVNVPVRLRGRGRSSWAYGYDKRPLRIRFNSPRSFADAAHSARDWVLISNHFDMSLMRTYAAFYLAGLLDGMDFAPFAQFVHLYINGEYYGLYMIADERDIGEGRLQLWFDEEPGRSDFLIQLDNRAHAGGDEGVDFFMLNERAYSVEFPSANARAREARAELNGVDLHFAYAEDFFSRVSAAAYAGDFEEISYLVDLPSMIDFYLVQELFKNIDVGFFSVFMTIRGGGGLPRRLHFGPVWDFDRSAGNTYYWYTPQFFHASVQNEFFSGFMAVPEIFEMTAHRFNEIILQIWQMIERIRYISYTYEAAFVRNFERFPVWDDEPEWMGWLIPAQTREITTWRGQVEFLVEWLEERVEWLGWHFNN